MERKSGLDLSGCHIRLQVQDRAGHCFQQNQAPPSATMSCCSGSRIEGGWKAFRQEAAEISSYSWSCLEPRQVCATSNPTGCPQKTAKPSSLTYISHATTSQSTLPRKATSKQNKSNTKKPQNQVLLLLAGVNEIKQSFVYIFYLCASVQCRTKRQLYA